MFKYMKLSFGWGGCWRPLFTSMWLRANLVNGNVIGFFVRVGLIWFQLTWGAI